MKKENVYVTVFAVLFIFLTGVGRTCAQIVTNNDTKIEINQNQTPMKIGIIIETKEYEKAWNAFRFAIVAKEQGYEVKVFLMGEGVECVGLTHDKYNVDEKLNEFVDMGGTVLACGTCLRSRNMSGTESCPMSNMMTCVDMVAWADKTVTF